MAKTVIIWDKCGDGPLSFYTCEGDLSELDGLYIGGEATEEQEDQLNKATEEGERSDWFPLEVLKEEEDVKVITAGITP